MTIPITKRRLGGMAQNAAIAAVSALIGILISWRAPGLDRYASDWLMRMRGTLAAPDDIVIIAIDEPSIARFGRFPWPRPVIGRAVDAIAAGQPKAIAIDILFADPTAPADDAALARSIQAAGNVALAAQLVEAPGAGSAAWITPIAPIAAAAAGTGHVNVLAEAEGGARELLARMSDDGGRAFLALPIETVRIAERAAASSVVDTGTSINVGRFSIPLESHERAASFSAAAGAPSPEVMRAGRMGIDYIGPSNSFAAKTYSAADVAEGRVPPATFSNRYVLIGATAASTGERFPSPFTHQDDSRGNQHGVLMPGVEVLANALNTILRGRFYTHASDPAIFVWCLSAAALTLWILGVAQGRFALLKQLAGLAAVAAVIVLCAYTAYTRLLWIAPLAPGMVSFASAGVLGLVRRSLLTSSELDGTIAAIAATGSKIIKPSSAQECAAAIARLTGASAVSVYDRTEQKSTLAASYGPALDLDRTSGVHVEQLANGAGVLIAACDNTHPPSRDMWRIAASIAEDCLACGGANVHQSPAIPNRLEDKAAILRLLNGELLRQTQFIDLALESVEDGLLIASTGGVIRFANRKAAEILESTPETLAGSDLFDRISQCATGPVRGPEALRRLVADRASFDQEVATRGQRPRHLALRIAPVQNGSGAVAGLVALLIDITRQKELQQTQKDVISLVSHEMRTPLSAIQGMSEVLANYDVPADRRRELTNAINDEVKRLTRMITQYLDLARLESGIASPRLTPVRLENLVDRLLLTLEPVAAARQIAIHRTYAPDLPPVMADADLLTRAAENLVSNAIKYSPPKSSITVALQKALNRVELEVADQGYGIPAEVQDRVFEKFYRVPRPQDADVPGTGLGLALVKEIAELHSGSVSLVSEPGAGSTFTLSLPADSMKEDV